MPSWGPPAAGRSAPGWDRGRCCTCGMPARPATGSAPARWRGGPPPRRGLERSRLAVDTTAEVARGVGPLRFGIWDWLDRPPGLPVAELYEQRLQVLEAADRAGFYCYHLAEHHGTP